MPTATKNRIRVPRPDSCNEMANCPVHPHFIYPHHLEKDEDATWIVPELYPTGAGEQPIRGYMQASFRRRRLS